MVGSISTCLLNKIVGGSKKKEVPLLWIYIYIYRTCKLLKEKSSGWLVQWKQMWQYINFEFLNYLLVSATVELCNCCRSSLKSGLSFNPFHVNPYYGFVFDFQLQSIALMEDLSFYATCFSFGSMPVPEPPFLRLC